MNDILQTASEWVSLPTWVLSAFLIVLAALLLEFFYRGFVNHLDRLAKKSHVLWDDAIVYAGRKPVSLLIWWQGVVMAARVVEPNLARWSVLIGGSAGLLFLVHVLGLVPAAPGLVQRVFNTLADAWYVLAAVWLLRRDRRARS